MFTCDIMCYNTFHVKCTRVTFSFGDTVCIYLFQKRKTKNEKNENDGNECFAHRV